MIADIIASRTLPLDGPSWRTEMIVPHRVLQRRFLLRFIEKGTTGAELGVFTGLFSAVLARQKKISRITFVDPWWLAFGQTYPSWGAYTDFGRLSTKTAYDLAVKRVNGARLPDRSVVCAFSYDWLAAQPDGSLDWAYLDSTHTYEGTKTELELLDRKISATGAIFGDDWQSDRSHRHHGVCLAVNEFVRASDFEFVLAGVNNQWILRRAATNRLALPILWNDPIYPTPSASSNSKVPAQAHQHLR